jgi:ArsR family metal-binding transcriptional regulator
MLIESYELEIEVSTHSAVHIEYEAIAYFSVDISPVLPYLNATLSRGIYLPDRPALSWRHEGHNIGFWPNRIAVENLHSREEVHQVVERLVKLVNETWERRDQLEPDWNTHPRLQPLQVYGLLPQTNCKACGEDSCFGFALKLVAGQIELERCTPLHDPSFEEQRTRLASQLETKWPAL